MPVRTAARVGGCAMLLALAAQGAAAQPPPQAPGAAVARSTRAPAPLASPPPAARDPRRSGFEFMQPATQALQADDTQNPATLWVQEGADLWRAPAGEARRACADCHEDAGASMRGVAARHPRFDEALAVPVLLATRINLCRTRHQRAAPFAAESQPLLALEAYVAFQSRGLPITPDPDARLARHRDRGEALYRQPMGQLALSCAQCHDDHAGRRLGGTPIPQGHPTGYPIYRLEWQVVGSLERRLRNCLAGVRAEPFALGAVEHAQLALYLATRAAGMPLETPAVRP